MIKSFSFHGILCLTILSLFACNKDTSLSDIDTFKSELTFEVDGESYSFVQVQEDTDPFDVTLTTKAQIGGPDSARITILKGLGEPIPNGQMRRNALYISFNNWSNGFFISLDQLQSWTSTGLKPFARDGEVEEGVGLIWIDNEGEVWTSGSAIGELRFTEGASLPLEAFPEPEQFQTNSRFTITFSKNIEPQLAHDWAQQVDVEFDAILYNAVGEQVVLSDGFFRTRLDIYNSK